VRPERGLQRSATYNDTLVTKLKHLREKGANVAPIDHRPFFAAAEGDWFAPDGLHLSAKGKDRFADILHRSAVL
jgi:lysophospholipase L1-like esterase